MPRFRESLRSVAPGRSQPFDHSLLCPLAQGQTLATTASFSGSVSDPSGRGFRTPMSR